MTKEQAIIEILKKDYCLTGFQIKGFVYRNYNIKYINMYREDLEDE